MIGFNQFIDSIMKTTLRIRFILYTIKLYTRFFFVCVDEMNGRESRQKNHECSAAHEKYKMSTTSIIFVGNLMQVYKIYTPYYIFFLSVNLKS
jgi:hypothetical protein